MARKGTMKLRFKPKYNDEFDTLVVDLEIAQKELVMQYWLGNEEHQQRPQEEN